MNETILIKIGELILKGNNRSRFEDRLMTNIKHALRHTGSYRIWKSQGTMYVEPKDENSKIAPAIESIKKVFGITQISPAYVAEKDMTARASVQVSCPTRRDRCTTLRPTTSTSCRRLRCP